MASHSRRGFTLIEILVVIAIISMLSTIVYAQIASARTKSVDTAKKAQLTIVRTAIASMVLDTGHAPHNYDCSGATCVVLSARTTLAIEDVASPGNPSTESGRAYLASMQELVNGRYLSGIPHSPGGAGYTYYDYGPGSAAGAMIGTTLDTIIPTAEGQVGTCRPFAGTGGVGFLHLKEIFRKISETTRAFAFTLPGPGAGETCWYLDPVGGYIYEAACPAATTQFCSANTSQDYCLCSVY
jgi:prepilin-type N-terminal cleavage/methylation domain-containing protein